MTTPCTTCRAHAAAAQPKCYVATIGMVLLAALVHSASGQNPPLQVASTNGTTWKWMGNFCPGPYFSNNAQPSHYSSNAQNWKNYMLFETTFNTTYPGLEIGSGGQMDGIISLAQCVSVCEFALGSAAQFWASHCVCFPSGWEGFDSVAAAALPENSSPTGGLYRRPSGGCANVHAYALQIPTLAPSSPTSEPTTEPTQQPSSLPTKEPTRSPSSSAPTRSPTKVPSTSPTVQPSYSPTTSNPTSTPTIAPTLSPTISSPTATPTLFPTLEPTFTDPPTASPSDLPTVSPTRSPVVITEANASDDGGGSSMIIIFAVVNVVVIIIIVAVIICMRRKCRIAETPITASTTVKRNNHINSNPEYATIERTYSEIGPSLSEYENPMRHNPVYDTKIFARSEIGAPTQPYALLETSHKTYAKTSAHDEIEAITQPYALLDTLHKTYATTGQEISLQNEPTMMAGFDSHPYDEVVQMSSRSDTGSTA